jgi:hypothetical protein
MLRMDDKKVVEIFLLKIFNIGVVRVYRSPAKAFK